MTPQLLHDVEFREAKRGGYNTQDVDDFLERLAVGLERQDAQLRDARQRIEAAEARVTEAERRAVMAEQRAAETSDSDETLKRTLVLAQRTADAAIREAEDQAARTLGSAQEQASRLLAEAQDVSVRARTHAEEEARAAHEETRAQLLEEMRELEAVRDQLRSDVDLLERHVDGQRDRLRLAIEQLQLVVDDPGALRAVDAPAISDVAVPAAVGATDSTGAAVEPELSSWSPEEDAWEPDDDVVPEAEPAPEPPSARREPDRDEGPPTQPVDMLEERDADDDAYLAELRKAMTDESPLGPRDEGPDLYDSGADQGRSRFGRRR